jgi:hypothetical protein
MNSLTDYLDSGLKPADGISAAFCIKTRLRFSVLSQRMPDQVISAISPQVDHNSCTIEATR